eukprot:scaffold16211_cov53-Phaeocystis_antarctica.AAC.4
MCGSLAVALPSPLTERPQESGADLLWVWVPCVACGCGPSSWSTAQTPGLQLLYGFIACVGGAVSLPSTVYTATLTKPRLGARTPAYLYCKDQRPHSLFVALALALIA